MKYPSPFSNLMCRIMYGMVHDVILSDNPEDGFTEIGWIDDIRDDLNTKAFPESDIAKAWSKAYKDAVELAAKGEFVADNSYQAVLDEKRESTRYKSRPPDEDEPECYPIIPPTIPLKCMPPNFQPGGKFCMTEDELREFIKWLTEMMKLANKYNFPWPPSGVMNCIMSDPALLAIWMELLWWLRAGNYGKAQRWLLRLLHELSIKCPNVSKWWIRQLLKKLKSFCNHGIPAVPEVSPLFCQDPPITFPLGDPDYTTDPLPPFEIPSGLPTEIPSPGNPPWSDEPNHWGHYPIMPDCDEPIDLLPCSPCMPEEGP